ncbi:MAG: hypothetical protein U0P46_07790 [Holophagaceae bacterium]
MPLPLPIHGAPVVIPHWEWRTFAAAGCEMALDGLGTRLGSAEGTEIRLICLPSSHDVAIRDGRMTLKWRKQARREGLECWDTVLDSTFPCPRETVQRLFEAWDVPSPEHPRCSYTLSAFLEEAVQSQPDLRVVEVQTHTEAFSVGGARCEWTRLTANAVPCQCLCIEHEDPGLILQVVRRLGLQPRMHASYPSGLKSALLLNTQH